MSAGASVAIQKATTGEVNWGQVAVAGTVGAVAGGAGAGAGLWAGNAMKLGTLSAPVRTAVLSGGENIVSGAVSRGLSGGDVLDPKAMAGDLLLGGGSGAVAGRLGSRGLVDLTTPQRRMHILYGDATGGGHLWPGLPGKTPFPRTWSEDVVIHNISDVATDPAAIRQTQGGVDVVTGTRHGADIRVLVGNATDEIKTGYATNLARNP
jgi:hypothetical protein